MPLTTEQRKQRRMEFAKIRGKRMIELTAQNDGYCHYCHRPFNDPRFPGLSKPTIDHIVPVVLGGNDELVNLVLACASCNTLKGDMPYEQYVRRVERRKTWGVVGALYRLWAEQHEQRQFAQGIANNYRELTPTPQSRQQKG